MSACNMCGAQFKWYTYTIIEIVDDQLLLISFCSERCKEVYELTGHLEGANAKPLIDLRDKKLLINKD